MNHACVCVSFYATLSFSRNFDVFYNDQRELYNNKGAQHHGLVLLHLCTYHLCTITLCCSVAAGRTGPAQCAAYHVACTVAGASSPVCIYTYVLLDEALYCRTVIWWYKLMYVIPRTMLYI